MKSCDELLVVYVKDPAVDLVKSRLAEVLGRERATGIYRKLLDYTRSVLGELDQDIRVSYANSIARNDVWEGFDKTTQIGDDLGSRMHADFEKAFEQGYRKVCLIGSDCLEIDADIITEAFDELDSHRAVFGPARDGGYYLVGLRNDLEKRSGLFEGISWSTAHVMRQTREKLDEQGVETHYLPILSDIDRVEDLPPDWQ